MRRTPDADDARDWQRQWRNEVDEERRETRKALSQIVTAMEGLVTRVEGLEQKPKEQRALFNSASSGLYTLIALGALVFDGFTTILALASVAVSIIALLHR